MSERLSWKFKYQVTDLLTPCITKIAHHKEREKYYLEQLEIAEKDLRENGIDMKQQALSVMSGSMSTGSNFNAYNYQPTFNQAKVDKINEFKKKVCEHRDKIVEYDRWLNAFNVALATGKETAKSISLDEDDVVFFGLSVG